MTSWAMAMEWLCLPIKYNVMIVIVEETWVEFECSMKVWEFKISTHDEDFVEGVEVGSLIGAQLTPQSVTVEIGSNQSMVVFIPI